MALESRHGPLGQRDALSLLRAEHDMLLRLFREYELLHDSAVPDDGRKAVLAARICRELAVHAALEEQAFYPAMLAAGSSPLLDDARVGHEAQQLLIGQLRALYLDEACFDATVGVLAEETQHHIAYEEGTLFERARSCGIDLQLLARELLERRHALERNPAVWAGAPASAAYDWNPRLQD